MEAILPESLWETSSAMRRWFSIIAFASLALAASASGFAQTPPPSSPGPMALQIRGEFLYAWNAYKQYAWGHDELKPLSKGYRDWHSVSLLMTPMDALDTMIMMGLTEEADKTREFIAKNLS
jgi:mannosidase alpha-like ER degradation enhancer 2